MEEGTNMLWLLMRFTYLVGVCTVQIASELLLFADIHICLVYIRPVAAEKDDLSR